MLEMEMMDFKEMKILPQTYGPGTERVRGAGRNGDVLTCMNMRQ
jgi:hypothetical protein